MTLPSVCTHPLLKFYTSTGLTNMSTYSLQTNNVLEVPDLGISTNTIVFCNTSCELTNTTPSLVRIGLKSELVQDYEIRASSRLRIRTKRCTTCNQEWETKPRQKLMVTHFDNQLNLVLPVCTPTYKSDVNKHKEYDRWPNLQHMLEITSVFIANSSVRGSTSKILSACRYQNPPPRHGPLGVAQLGEDDLNADLAGLLRCHLHVGDHHRLVRLVVQRRCTHPPDQTTQFQE
jgi:hypothetical protein